MFLGLGRGEPNVKYKQFVVCDRSLRLPNWLRSPHSADAADEAFPRPITGLITVPVRARGRDSLRSEFFGRYAAGRGDEPNYGDGAGARGERSGRRAGEEGAD